MKSTTKVEFMSKVLPVPNSETSDIIWDLPCHVLRLEQDSGWK